MLDFLKVQAAGRKGSASLRGGILINPTKYTRISFAFREVL
jgi:3-dehydroquinate dehydratase